MSTCTMSSELDQQTRHVLEKFKVDSSKILNIKQLAYVKAAMIRVMASWENIGIYWGIDTSDLDVIKRTYRDIERRFTEMVAKWLQNGNQTQPTWEKVVIAISATTAGRNPAEAQKLAKSCQEAGVESLCTVPEADGVDESGIGEGAINEVMKALEPVSAEWSNIGVMLGLSYNFIRLLGEDDDIMDRIRSLAERWLKKNFDFKNFGVPSWKKLVEVIGAKAGGGDSAHALKIAKEHYVAVTVKNSSRKRAHSGPEDATYSGEHTNGADTRKIPRLEGDTTDGAVKNGNGAKNSDADLTLDHKSHYKITPYLKTIKTEDLVDLGAALGLNRMKLKNTHPNELVGELISSWIRKDNEVLSVSGEPTWRVLAKKLKEVGKNGVAQDIQKDIGFHL